MDAPIRKLDFEELKSARPSLQEVRLSTRVPIAVVLENIRSLYNVGSIFRTSDGANVEKLYLCGYTGRPPRKEIDKTSLGSAESVPWEYVPEAASAVAELKSRGYQIVSLEHTDRSVPYTEAEYRFPLCLIVGNEVEGVSGELVSLCDMAVEIPMYGIKQSLNVSVAFGIAAYHITHRYRGAAGGGTDRIITRDRG
jgi:tRNA G18 (ribose-2'-O)-methylase SpoU